LVLRGGIGSLGEGLAQRLEIRTGCWVSGVEKGESGVAVHHSGGTVEADHVVFACPANAITRIEGDIAAEDRAALSAVRYAPAMNLFFGYERSITVQHPVVMAAGPDRHPVATVWTTSRWIPEHVPEGKEVVCIQPASWRSGELLELDPAKVVSAIRAEAEEVFGRLADPDWIRLYPWPGGLVLPVPGHYRRMSELVRRPRERIHFAGDWITGSSVEGALRTGLQAAERILASAS
jgi:predicted NAD/FAD-dependent oxidoreductase